MSEREGDIASLPPRENPNLYGHEAAEQSLLEAWRSGRLPHAWIIGGPRGIGKATLAFRFARFIFAGGGKGGPGGAGLFGAEPPPESLGIAPDHPVFRRVASSGHADLLTVERQLDERGRLRSEIVVDDARAVSEFLHLTPAEGGWRVVVIDGAEEMNRNAANAVLKIVEEPPRQALILLVSHAPGRLLPTIRSRCRRLALQALPPSIIERILAEQQQPGLAPDQAAGLAILAEGSAGRALALAEEGGLAILRDLLALLEGLPRLDVAALHKLGERVTGNDGQATFRVMSELLLWWLMRLVKAAGSGEAPSEILPGEAGLYLRLAGPRNLDRWLEVWEKAKLLFAQADSLALDRKQVMLTALMAFEGAARA
jgi:DNA polymerase III subunit delta'